MIFTALIWINSDYLQQCLEEYHAEKCCNIAQKHTRQ
jgi:hypothetical protein